MKGGFWICCTFEKSPQTAKESVGSVDTENTQLTTSPTMKILFLTCRTSSMTLVLKHQPRSILYNSSGRICICNILWLIRCMNGFLKSFMIKKCFKPVNGKRMLYNEISFYMLFLNNVCSETLCKSDTEHLSFIWSIILLSPPSNKHKCCSTTARPVREVYLLWV